MVTPCEAVLQHFGVHLVSPLGGRRNQHWQVASDRDSLILRRWAGDAADIEYELRLLTHIKALGWPVAAGIDEPIFLQDAFWSLFPLLPGTPRPTHGAPTEQRARGNLLARFHSDLSQIKGFEQRGAWRRCEQILGDETTDALLADYEAQSPDEAYILRWHLDRARKRINGLSLADKPGSIVHGDFTAWNLLYVGERLSGVLDFELSHANHRVADFALSWRGKYDQVIHGYNDVSPLAQEEWTLLTPAWWAFLIELACRHISEGTPLDGWIVEKILGRSPLMGVDAAEFQR